MKVRFTPLKGAALNVLGLYLAALGLCFRFILENPAWFPGVLIQPLTGGLASIIPLGKPVSAFAAGLVTASFSFFLAWLAWSSGRRWICYLYNIISAAILLYFKYLLMALEMM
jgi:hypothetical protein